MWRALSIAAVATAGCRAPDVAEGPYEIVFRWASRDQISGDDLGYFPPAMQLWNLVETASGPTPTFELDRWQMDGFGENATYIDTIVDVTADEDGTIAVSWAFAATCGGEDLGRLDVTVVPDRDSDAELPGFTGTYDLYQPPPAGDCTAAALARWWALDLTGTAAVGWDDLTLEDSQRIVVEPL